MEIWLDSTDTKLISDAAARGLLHGVTTNPTLVARSNQSLEELLDELLDIQDGPVAAQIVATSQKEMIRQAEVLTAHSPRVIIKIPASQEGIIAIRTLSQEKVPVMATAIFDPLQAIVALKAGAHYLAPYLGRMEQEGYVALDVLGQIQHYITAYQMKTKILAAAVRSCDTLLQCSKLGIAAITLPAEVYCKLVQSHPGTQKAMEEFAEQTKTAV